MRRPSPPPWLGRSLRVGVVLLALALLVRELVGTGPAALDAAREIGPGRALLSLLAVLVGLLSSALVWRALMAELGTALPPRATLHVFFLGQLAKYIPGSVFAIAAQMDLARAHGAPRSRTGTAGLLFMGVLTAAGLLTAAVVLPLTSPDALRRYTWVLLLLPVGLLCLAPPVLTRLVAVLLRVLGRAPLDRPLMARGVGAAVGWALGVWVAYGVHLVLLVGPIAGDVGPNLLLLSTGAYALAWTAGFLFVIAPAGFGVRELALVAALAPVLDRTGALAVAVLSRVLMTLGDASWALVGGVADRRWFGTRGAAATRMETARAHEQPEPAADD